MNNTRVVHFSRADAEVARGVQSNISTTASTAANYGSPRLHPNIHDLARQICSIRDDEEDVHVADSTVMYALEAILRLPAGIPSPNIEIDDEGILELEWEHEGQSFSLYITDTRRTAFAGYFGKNDVLSGYQDVQEIFDGDDLYHIQRVFRPVASKWASVTA